MIWLHIKASALGLRRRFRASQKKMRNMRPELDLVGKWVVSDARKRLVARNSPVSLGRLGKSLRHRAYRTQVVITSSRPYAGIQQFGGTVRPNKRKALAIPLQLDLARKHRWPKHYLSFKTLKLIRIADVLWEFKLKAVPKKGRHLDRTAQRHARRAGLRNQTTIKRDRKGQLDTTTKRWEMVRPAYKLKKRVRIKERPYLVDSPALRRFMRLLFIRAIEDTDKQSGTG